MSNELKVLNEFKRVFAEVTANAWVGDEVSVTMRIEWEDGAPKGHNSQIDYKTDGKKRGSPHTVSVANALANVYSFVNAPQLEKAYTMITLKGSVDYHDVLNLDGEMAYTSLMSDLVYVKA